MEVKLLNRGALSISEAFPQIERLCSSSVSSVAFSRRASSRNGISPKAAYANGSFGSKEVVCSDGDESGRAERFLYRINGLSGSLSNLWPREIRVLDAIDDEYGGVVVNPERLPSNANAFAYLLRSSLSHWKIEGKQGVWLKLPVERSELVPIAVKEGFEYHHAERGYVMLTRWIPDGPSMLPNNASHLVGVGGFVINENNEVLVVQEKHCCDPACAGLWKIPTGFIHESEEIFTGAVREVKEETGIDTEFIEVVAFRHVHNVAFEKSDLFFICMLRSLSSEISIDDHEIQAAKWMALDEFVEQPLIQEDCMFKKVMDICMARLGKRYCGLSSHRLVSKFDGKPSTLYYNVMDSPDSNCLGTN